jgi:hypothetical protein
LTFKVESFFLYPDKYSKKVNPHATFNLNEKQQTPNPKYSLPIVQSGRRNPKPQAIEGKADIL